MRKTAFFLSIIITLTFLFPVRLSADGPDTPQPNPDSSQTDSAPAQTNPNAPSSNYSVPFPITETAAYYMVEMKTDTVIFAQNEHKRMVPASLTKIMTAILTLENCPDLSVKIPYKLAIQDEIYQQNVAIGGGISVAGLHAGEEVSIEDLLYATLVASGNEAACILADYVGGDSMTHFYEMMNNKAKELGAVDTNFVNPNGLYDANHYTTAYDMYLITRYAMQNETFAKIVSTARYESAPTNKNESGYVWANTNKMLNPQSNYYSPIINGVKTGTLDEAGRCLITTAKKSGYEYMLVMMGTPLYDSEGKLLPNRTDFEQTTQFYNWAFENYKVKTVIEKGSVVYDIDLRLAKDGKKKVQLMSGATFSTLMPQNYNIDNVRTVPELNSSLLNPDKSINAPVEKGQQVGELRLILAGKEIGRVELLAAETIQRSEALYILDRIRGFFSSFWFKFFFLFVLIFGGLYILLVVLRNHNKRKYRHVRRRRRL